jgi:CheY-like chemotaxis protein
MSQPFRVHLLGFSEFERSALGSYFRLASNREPSFQQVARAADAHFLVVDADHATAAQAQGRLAQSVFIGARAPDGAAAWMARPIDPLHVLRELDALAAALMPAPRPAANGAVRTVIQPPRRGTPPPRRFNGSAEVRIGVPLAAPPPPRPAGRNALLVDDSELALRFLEVKLQPFGLRTERAATSGQALSMLAQRRFDFVFLDIELGRESALDGIALCHQIKRAQVLPADRPVPVVTLVSAHASEIDRVRGALAGADAYLGKPLDERALAQVLVEHGVAPATVNA